MEGIEVSLIDRFKTLDGSTGEFSNNTTYIASSSEFISMPSGNDLSTNCFLGEPCGTQITKKNGNTFIIEEYESDKSKHDFYSKETEIIKTNITTIIETLFINKFNGVDYDKIVFKVKETTINNGNIEEKIYSDEEYREREGE